MTIWAGAVDHRAGWVALGMDADLAAKLYALAEHVSRNVLLRHEPECFDVEKFCIAQDLEHLTFHLEEKTERRPILTINRQRAAAQRFSVPKN